MPFTALLRKKNEKVRSILQLGFDVLLVEQHTKVQMELVDEVKRRKGKRRIGKIVVREVDSLCYEVWYLADLWEPTQIAIDASFELSERPNIRGMRLTETRYDYGLNALIVQAWLSLSPKSGYPEECWHQHPKILSLPEFHRHFKRENKKPKGPLPALVVD